MGLPRRPSDRCCGMGFGEAQRQAWRPSSFRNQGRVASLDAAAWRVIGGSLWELIEVLPTGYYFHRVNLNIPPSKLPSSDGSRRRLQCEPSLWSPTRPPRGFQKLRHSHLNNFGIPGVQQTARFGKERQSRRGYIDRGDLMGRAIAALVFAQCKLRLIGVVGGAASGPERLVSHKNQPVKLISDLPHLN